MVFIRFVTPAAFCVLTLFVNNASGYVCQSCFNGCASLEHCDCRNATCNGPFCFARLEYFHDDRVSSILKGCVDYVPDKLLGCHYAGDNSSIQCFCRGDSCNVVERLANYKADNMDVVNCCECNSKDNPKICRLNSCTSTCAGNYCFLDVADESQGCGLGYPQIFNELRTRNVSAFISQRTCVKSTIGDPKLSRWMHGCSCAANLCNRLDNLQNASNAVLDDRAPTIKCHSFSDSSDKPITVDVFRKASFCEGHFCYLTLTTHQVVFESNNREEGYDDEDDEGAEYSDASYADTLPYFRAKHDFTVGCLVVDNSSKIQLGCTTEYLDTDTAVITKHCVCMGDYCNFYNLVSGDRAATLVPMRASSSSSANHFNLIATNEPKAPQLPGPTSGVQCIQDSLVFMLLLFVHLFVLRWF